MYVHSHELPCPALPLMACYSYLTDEFFGHEELTVAIDLLSGRVDGVF